MPLKEEARSSKTRSLLLQRREACCRQTSTQQELEACWLAEALELNEGNIKARKSVTRVAQTSLRWGSLGKEACYIWAGAFGALISGNSYMVSVFRLVVGLSTRM